MSIEIDRYEYLEAMDEYLKSAFRDGAEEFAADLGRIPQLSGQLHQQLTDGYLQQHVYDSDTPNPVGKINESEAAVTFFWLFQEMQTVYKRLAEKAIEKRMHKN
jgi:hypothetical protein